MFGCNPWELPATRFFFFFLSIWTVVKYPQNPLVLSATWHLKRWHSGPERVPAVHLSWHCSFQFPANLTKKEAFLCLPELNFICQPFWSLLCILRACTLQAMLFSIPKNIVIFRFYLKRKHKTFYYWGWTELSAQPGQSTQWQAHRASWASSSKWASSVLP